MRTRNYHITYLNNTQVHTVGCEMSVSDANKFASTLDTTKENIVFSTCSFLGEKEQECQTILRLLRKLNPNYNFYILGCDVENNRDKYDFGTIISKEELKERISGITDEIYTDEEMYIKIQDGCQHQCTYCIVNKLRPTPFSVPFKDIMATLEKHKPSEICIAGTEITNYYDEETGYDLIGLLEKIKELPYIKRVTLSSVDPAPKITRKLIEFVGKNRDIFVPYILLAAQSGSDEVLKMMKRRHNVDRLYELHSLADECKVALGWEIIVGFPGETNELFLETLDVVEELQPFTKCIFEYSPRAGTPAVNYDGQVSEEDKKDRADAIREILDTCHDRNIGNYSYFLNYTRDHLCNRHYSQIISKVLNSFDEGQEDLLNVDLTSDESVLYAIQNAGTGTVLYADFNGDDESEIRLGFIREHLKGNPIILRVDEFFSEDLEIFGKYYGCMVKRWFNGQIHSS